MKDSRLPQPLLDFLTPIEELFYPPSLVFKFRIIYSNPKSNFEIVVSSLKFLDSSKITRLTNDNILVYRVV